MTVYLGNAGNIELTRDSGDTIGAPLKLLVLMLARIC